MADGVAWHGIALHRMARHAIFALLFKLSSEPDVRIVLVPPYSACVYPSYGACVYHSLVLVCTTHSLERKGYLWSLT